jgi:hypothetical protein
MSETGWTILGLVFTTIISLIGIVSSNIRRWQKEVLVTFTVLGCAVGILAARSAQNDATKSEQKADEARVTAETQRKNAEAQRAFLQKTLNTVNLTVGDLGALSKLSGGLQYYVQISADSNPHNLACSLKRINSEFRGAVSSGMVAIRQTKPHEYVLVFGQHLDITAAGVYQQLAMSHRLTRPGDVAFIRAEPAISPKQLPVEKLELEQCSLKQSLSAPAARDATR